MAQDVLGRDSLVGQQLSHYCIAARIGGGGMGIVYCARDEHLHRDVAVKILPQGALADESPIYLIVNWFPEIKAKLRK